MPGLPGCSSLRARRPEGGHEPPPAARHRSVKDIEEVVEIVERFGHMIPERAAPALALLAPYRTVLCKMFLPAFGRMRDCGFSLAGCPLALSHLRLQGGDAADRGAASMTKQTLSRRDGKGRAGIAIAAGDDPDRVRTFTHIPDIGDVDADGQSQKALRIAPRRDIFPSANLCGRGRSMAAGFTCCRLLLGRQFCPRPSFPQFLLPIS